MHVPPVLHPSTSHSSSKLTPGKKKKVTPSENDPKPIEEALPATPSGGGAKCSEQPCLLPQQVEGQAGDASAHDSDSHAHDKHLPQADLPPVADHAAGSSGRSVPDGRVPREVMAEDLPAL